MPNPFTASIREILAKQGFVVPDDDTLTQTLGDLNRPEIMAAPGFREDYDAIRQANSPGTIGGIVNTAKNAFDRSRQALNVVGGIGEVDAGDIADAERRIQSRTASPAWQDWQRLEGADAARAFLRDPVEIVSNIVASGFAGSLPALGGGISGGLAGGAAGSAIPGVGNVAGGAIGAAIGTGAGSLSVELGNKYLEVLREAGADLTDPQSILRVVSNPETRDRALEMGLRRGIPVAVFDAASAGLAGKFLSGVRNATTGQMVRRGLSEAAIQGALGGGGEVAGALSAGERISPGAVFEEVIGEVGPGAVETGAGVARRRFAEQPSAPQQLPTIAPNNSSQQPAVAPNIAPVSSQQVAAEPEQSPASRVALMSDEQRAARLAELLAVPTPSPAEAQEIEILRALVPQAAPVAETPVNATPVVESQTPVGLTQEPQNPQVFFEPPAPVGVFQESTLSAAPEPIVPPVTDTPAAPVEAAAPFLPESVIPQAPSPVAETLGVPALEQPAVVSPSAIAPAAPINPTGEASLPTGQPAPVVPETPEVPATPQPSPTLVERVKTEVEKPQPFAFGTVIEDAPLTVDVREDDQFENLTPEVASTFTIPGAMDQAGNRARTRVGIVLESPDGRYTMTGLLPTQEIASVGPNGKRASGPALQAMAGERRGNGYEKFIKEGGNRPALLADVIAAGYKVRAFVQFNGEPGNIFQRWPNRETYDATFSASPRTTRAQESASALLRPTVTASEGIERRNVRRREQEIQSQIDRLVREQQTADPARSAEINEEVRALYTELGSLPEIQRSTVPEGDGGIDSTSAAAFKFVNVPVGDIPAATRETLADFERGLNRSVPRGASRYRLTPQAPSADSLRGPAGEGASAAGVRADSVGQGATGYLLRLSEGLGRLLGKRVYFVDPGVDTDTAAFTSPERANDILLNTRHTAPIAALFGHELGHQIKTQRPELWARVAELVEATNPMPEEYRNEKAKTYASPIDEWVNDVIGQRWDEAEFWREVGAVAEERGVTAQFRELVQAALDWLTEIARRIRSTLSDDAAAPALAEINRLRRVIAEVFVDYGMGGPYADNPGFSGSPDAELSTVNTPAQASRADDFATVIARLRQTGAKVDVFSNALFQRSLQAEIEQRLAALNQRVATAPESQRAAIEAEIGRLTEAQEAGERVRGVTFTPDHIAVGLDDVQNANTAGLVWLLHEAGHALLGRSPRMHTRVINAVNATMADVRAQLAAAQQATGVREQPTNDAEELIVSTLAQRMASEGIPDSSSLARAAWQWVKDVYFRLAMAVQEAFGREPSSQLALDWFENQMRRVIGGDYDYRFADIFNRFGPEPIGTQYMRQTEAATGPSTPGNLTNYHNQISDRVEQPATVPQSTADIAWNLRFATEAMPESTGREEGLEIPRPEAQARIMGAAIAEEASVADELYAAAVEANPQLTYEQWWTAVGAGENPRVRQAALEQSVPGSAQARIDGERMTEAMNGLARVQAKQLIYRLRSSVQQKLARGQERTARAERDLLSTAKAMNRVETGLRDATMHEATLRDALKEQIRELSQSIKRGLDTAARSGSLAQAVRDAEQLAESDPIPAEYQRVFERVLADEIPLFDYVDAIAQLDLPLSDLTAPEFYDAIEANAPSDPVLGRLMERRNKPLLVALRSLLKRNAEQVDMLRLRRADAAEFLRVNGDLKDIRSASEERLKQLAATIRKDRRAATYADRLKRAYVERRTRLRDAQRAIQEAETNRTLLTEAQEAIRAKVEELETGGLAAPSEWMPRAGETYLAMRQDAEGNWSSARRTLNFTREGPPVDAAQVRTDLAGNWTYLKDNQDKAGSRTYELVKRQTEQLALMDVSRTYPESKRVFFERWLLPSADAILTGGGAGAARAAQMLKKFQFITFSNWENDIYGPSLEWSNRLRQVAAASGLRDPQTFLDEVYDPVLYLIQSEPGLEEGPALRQALAAAKRRLPGEAAENFDALLRDFLIRTKTLSERFVKIAEESGVFVEDQRIGGELRKAVARGWLTTMRRMKAATVSTILREMDDAGWRLQFAGEDNVAGLDTFDRGTAAGKRPVRSSTFDALMPGRADGEEAAATAAGVLANPELFGQAISGFFTPGIVNRWLVPFINKPGDPVFTDARGEGIDPLVVQQAWADSGGNVAGWIDLLGQRTGLEPTQEGSEVSPEAEWRLSMLRQIDSLYLMESRIAADANQVRNLFDPSGRPAHLLMDARENDLLPPEHIEHAGFDPISSRNLLATLAFHASFGRNGRDMEAALNEIKSDLLARKQAFQQLRGSSERARREDAQARGMNYASLKQAATVYKQVEEGEQTLRAAFGFGNEAGVMGDMRIPLQLLAFVAGQTTNTPKTGLLNLLQLTQRMIARRTIDPVALRDTARAGGEVVKQFFGSLLESFGLHMVRATAHAKDIGAVQGQGFGQLPWTEVLGVGAGKRGEQTPTAINMMRTFSALQRKGVRVGFGEAQEFPRYGNVPFLANTMGSISLAAAISNGTAEATSVESLVKAAMDYFAANPQDMANPNFKLTAKDLRAASAAWFSSPGSFEYFQRSLVDYGMGTLEDMARGAMERANAGEPILTREQVLKAAMMAGNELDLQSSINTNPGSWASNPILKFATPLLGYPIRAMAQVHSAMRKPDGTFATRQALKTLGILAAWSLPVGLAFTLMTDEYDEKLIRKKTNLGQISADLPVRDNAIAVLQRLSRAGNIYGLGADFASSILAGMDPTSGQRAFSLDSRILAFSQLRTIADAIGNFISSDYALTYAGVERPLLQAIGGNGALGAIDIFNGVLGFDNQQARITSRTNVMQWLRAAGREAGIELARGGGGSVQATPVGTWTREMLLASLSNDRLGFLDAYRRAIDAAREAGAPDPEKKVLESWRSRSPLEVFRTKPSEQELQKALNLMSDDGKKAVRDALRLFDQYTDMISPSEAEKARDRVLQSMRRPQMDLNSIRRQLAGGALTVR